MPILPNNHLTVLISRDKLTIYNKVGFDPKVIPFAQPKNAIVESLKKTLSELSGNKKIIEVNLLFSADMSFFSSSRKTASELMSVADQILPYSTEEAEFFIIQDKEISTIFAIPNPTKLLLEQTFGNRLKIDQFIPILLLYSPKVIAKLSDHSHNVLTCLVTGDTVTTILNSGELVVDYQTYKNLKIEDLIPKLIEVYKTDPDFLLEIDTVISQSDLKIPTLSKIKFITHQIQAQSLDDLLIANFSKFKIPEVLSFDKIKKSENNDQVLKQPDSNHKQALSENKISPKIIAIGSIVLLLLIILGIIIFIQFQSVKPKNTRQNGTVAPKPASQPIIIPSQRFSQPRTNTSGQNSPSSESAQPQ